MIKKVAQIILSLEGSKRELLKYGHRQKRNVNFVNDKFMTNGLAAKYNKCLQIVVSFSTKTLILIFS